MVIVEQYKLVCDMVYNMLWAGDKLILAAVGRQGGEVYQKNL